MLPEKTKDILRRILSYVHHWKNEASLYASDMNIKKSIRTLFHRIITLVGFAKYHSMQRRWKRILRVLLRQTSIEQAMRDLQYSADSVDRVLHVAAAQCTSCYTCLDLFPYFGPY